MTYNHTAYVYAIRCPACRVKVLLYAVERIPVVNTEFCCDNCDYIGNMTVLHSV